MNGQANPPTPLNQIEPQHLVDILRYCIRQYAVSHELDTEQVQDVTIEDLVEWCKKEELPLSARFEIRQHTYNGSGGQPAGSKITTQAVQIVWDQLQNPYAAVKLLLPIWTWIVEKRPPLTIQPVMMEVGVAIIFANQTAMQIRMPTNLSHEKPVSSGFLSSLVYNQMIQLVGDLAIHGIDALREAHAQPCELPPGMPGTEGGLQQDGPGTENG